MRKPEKQYRKELKEWQAKKPKGGSNYEYEEWMEEKPGRNLSPDGKPRK